MIQDLKTFVLFCWEKLWLQKPSNHPGRIRCLRTDLPGSKTASSNLRREDNHRVRQLGFLNHFRMCHYRHMVCWKIPKIARCFMIFPAINHILNISELRCSIYFSDSHCICSLFNTSFDSHCFVWALQIQCIGYRVILNFRLTWIRHEKQNELISKSVGEIIAFLRMSDVNICFNHLQSISIDIFFRSQFVWDSVAVEYRFVHPHHWIDSKEAYVFSLLGLASSKLTVGPWKYTNFLVATNLATPIW